MTDTPTESPPSNQPPRIVAVSGMIFSGLYIATIVLIRLSAPADPAESGAWLADPTYRQWAGIAINLFPICGIAFLWFMAVLRNRIGMQEDRFFATVFFASGLLFVAMLFVAGAVCQGLLTFGDSPQTPAASETWRLGRTIVYSLLNIFGLKMAAVFMFVTSTIGLRTAVFAPWVSYVGYACGLAMLFAFTDFPWIALLFPAWVMLVSLWILVVDARSGEET